MYKRKIVKFLSDWSKKPHKEAILIKGARQVGKTTIVREFGRKNYKNFVEINFELDPAAKTAFDGKRDTKTIIGNLSLMGYGPFVEGKTLVFFDEIQSCPNARTAIKFLVEEGLYDYIESGSLLGINYKDVSSYPVGFERQIEMFPMDFEEFLWARGVSELAVETLREAFLNQSPVTSFVHEQMMKHYREYLIVGGMPEVVATYNNNPDFAATLLQQRKIIQSYRDDIAKYAAEQKTKAKRFFDAIPSELSKQKKRFILKNMEQTASMQKYEDAASWLDDAGVAYFCYNLHSLALPFEQEENRSLFKVYLLDTGLLCALWNDNIQLKVMQGEIDINEGALTENFVAAELRKHGWKLHYYDRKSRQELDFLLAENNKVTIVEVKSGDEYQRHASVDTALREQSEKIGKVMVMSKFNLENTENILYVPLYMAAFI
ncbi:MAG: ATP-binding protein [Bacteroidales bacterium]|nr:ATP-binding protein [Bacteroidales bacterium]